MVGMSPSFVRRRVIFGAFKLPKLGRNVTLSAAQRIASGAPARSMLAFGLDHRNTGWLTYRWNGPSQAREQEREAMPAKPDRL
jgi:hypothetical protein